MLARRTWILLVAVLLIFGFGIGELFVLRFSRGDIYPPYSSLRADPLGGKVLYDALSGLENLTVSRNQSPLELLKEKSGSTIIYIGIPARYFLYDGELTTLGKLAAAGHRVIIGLMPETEVPKNEVEKEPADKKKAKPSETPAKVILAPALWKLDIVKVPGKETKPLQMTGLDQAISYHSSLGFVSKNATWKTLASVGKTPVVVERKFGLGSLVLLADSYPLSNEALRKERRPILLTTLLV